MSIGVEDAAAISGAVVSVTQDATSYTATTTATATTNALGVAEFSLNTGDWVVSITKPLYSYTPSVLTVSGVTAATLTMTGLAVVLPGEPELCAVIVRAVDKEGVPVNLEFYRAPALETGYAYSTDDQTELSDENGYVQFKAVRGAKYLLSRGVDANRIKKVGEIPTDQDTVTLASITGE